MSLDRQLRAVANKMIFYWFDTILPLQLQKSHLYLIHSRIFITVYTNLVNVGAMSLFLFVKAHCVGTIMYIFIY